MKTAEERREAIRQLVRYEYISNQAQIAKGLAGLGHECSQGTVSRDIGDLELRKDSDGRYFLKEDLLLKRMFDDFVVHLVHAQNLVIIKTTSGTAQGVAAAFDGTAMTEVLGTIAGDDTIFIATADEKSAVALLATLEAIKTS